MIRRSKEGSGEERRLTWEDTKNMPLTTRVIQETLRVASILSFTFREAVEDVEYGGQSFQPRFYFPRKEKTKVAFALLDYAETDFVSIIALRVPHTQRLESLALVQEHPPRPRDLPRARQVRPLEVRGEQFRSNKRKGQSSSMFSKVDVREKSPKQTIAF